jgi:DNA repair protein RadC
VTYVDTKIFTASALGSGLTAALLFGRTVLSIKSWKKYGFAKSQNVSELQEQQKREKQKLEDANMAFSSSSNTTESKSQSLIQVQKEKLSKLNYDYFKNKKVLTCEMVDIGYVTMVENQFMTVIRNGRGRQLQYVIPTYYVRECDNERVLIDTSVRYIDRYQVKENTRA